MKFLLRTLIIACLFSTSVPAALTADNLLLVVNKNVPDGQKLAEYYAQQRHVPAGRIVSLDLPTGDEMSIDDFDEKMVAPLRDFLTANQLRGQVTCVVNFYGVPLRIPSRQNTAELRAELVSLRKQLTQATKQTQTMVESLEKFATEVDASFKPLQQPAGERLEPFEILPRRAEYAAGFAMTRLQKMPGDVKRAELEAEFKAQSDQFRAPVNIAEPSIVPATAPASNEALTQEQIATRMTELSQHRGDASARRAFRDLAREHAGIILFLQIVAGQEQYLTPDEKPNERSTEAAVDNELAAMWWGLYPRFRWQANPLNYKFPARGKQTLMVMRLDGANADQVHAIIDTSIKVGNEGLKGKIVLSQPSRAVRMLEDDRPTLIPPGAVKDCAIYCGWYSPGKFVPSVSLVPGAVAAHIASYEMTTLHGVTAAWCRNLLDGGAGATFGPVAEPYLHAFPPANEFFGVLLTGKLTLAETYWSTNPLVSWKMSIVGDPLYIPFKTNPALSPSDLPLQMQGIFAHSTSAPTDR